MCAATTWSPICEQSLCRQQRLAGAGLARDDDDALLVQERIVEIRLGQRMLRAEVQEVGVGAQQEGRLPQTEELEAHLLVHGLRVSEFLQRRNRFQADFTLSR
jgi:hypothetical protein